MNEPIVRKSRSWVTIAALAVVVLYPLSFGPACWIYPRSYYTLHRANSSVILDTVYYPIIWLQYRGPRFVGTMISNYANWGTGRYTVGFSYVFRRYEGHIYLWDPGNMIFDSY